MINAQDKKIQNIFDKKIHFFLLKCSNYKQPFKSISWSDSSRILSGRYKNDANGSIFYILVKYWFITPSTDFTESVISHTSSASGILNKMNHIPTLSSTRKCTTEPNGWLPTSTCALLFPNKRVSWFLFN